MAHRAQSKHSDSSNAIDVTHCLIKCWPIYFLESSHTTRTRVLWIRRPLESLWGGASAARLGGGLCIVKESPSRRFATAVAAVKASQAFTPSGGGDFLRNRKLQSLPLSAHVMHLVSSFPQKRESSLNSGLRRVCPE